MARRRTTTMSSKRPKMPKTASGIMSSGLIRYMMAATTQRTMRMRNMYISPLKEKKSLVRWRSRVGRSYR